MKVLVVEDDTRLRHFIVKSLHTEDYEVDATGDGEEASRWVSLNAYDVVLLDWMVPGKDGLTLAREMREAGSRAAILFVTAKSHLPDRIAGLDGGADDYIVKPFHVDELLARVRVHARRSDNHSGTIRTFGALRLDLVRHLVFLQSTPISITEREYGLIELLSRSPGQIYTRAQILGEVWKINFNPRTNVIDVYVNKLRKKFGICPDAPRIETIRSVGYRLTAAKP